MSKFVIRRASTLALSLVCFALAVPAQARPPVGPDGTPIIEPIEPPGTTPPIANSLRLPCLRPGERAQDHPGMISCECLLRNPEDKKCPKRLKDFRGIIGEMEHRLQTYIDPKLAKAKSGEVLPSVGLYGPPPGGGIDQNPLQDVQPQNLLDNAVPFCNRAPICSLLPTEFSLKDGTPFAEEASNHMGTSCGRFRDVRVVRRGRRAVVQFYGTGERERAWFCGSLVTSLAHHSRKVASELESSYAISLPQPTGAAPHACQAFFDKLKGTQATYEREIAAEQRTLVDQKNIADVAACDVQPRELNDLAADRRVSMTHLCSTQMAIFSAFTQLSLCRAFADGKEQYERQFGDPVAARNNLLSISNQVNRQCTSRVMSGGRSNATRNAKACYDEKAPAAFRSLFQSLWSPYAN